MPGSPSELADAIGVRMDAGMLAPAQRRRIRAWSLETIAGDAVAQYFVSLMDHIYRCGPRPEAPWRS